MDQVSEAALLPEPSARERHAALLLHGLPATVQRRVMAALEPIERQRLQPLLNDLVEIGMPAEAATTLPKEPPAPAPRTPVERAAALAAGVVVRALKQCPPPLARSFIGARAWPWQEAVLSAMRGDLGAEASQRKDAEALPPAVLECMCDLLCEDAAGQPAEVQRPRHPWRRFLSWTR